MTLTPLPADRLDGLREALTAAALPHADFDQPGREFLAGWLDGRIVGFIGLERYGTRALLRSLVVVNAERGRGFGTALVRGAIDAAATAGVTEFWVLTTTAAPFLERLGFVRVGRDAAPAEIRATSEFASLCPASAVCLTLMPRTVPGTTGGAASAAPSG